MHPTHLPQVSEKQKIGSLLSQRLSQSGNWWEHWGHHWPLVTLVTMVTMVPVSCCTETRLLINKQIQIQMRVSFSFSLCVTGSARLHQVVTPRHKLPVLSPWNKHKHHVVTLCDVITRPCDQLWIKSFKIKHSCEDATWGGNCGGGRCFVSLKREKCSSVWKWSGHCESSGCSLLRNHFHNTMNSKLSGGISLSWFVSHHPRFARLFLLLAQTSSLCVWQQLRPEPPAALTSSTSVSRH